MSKYVKKKSSQVNIRPELIYVLIIVFAVVITAACQRMKYEKRIEEINAGFEEQLEVLRADYETKITELKQYYEYGGDVSQIEREAEYIAKVLYGTAANHADSDKKAVVWCVLNRVDHNSHPDTVEEVCEQPKQWMGYSSDNPVVADLYELALEELKVWHSGEHRPMNSSYIYLSWSSKEILLRDTFEVSKNTNYWRMR